MRHFCRDSSKFGVYYNPNSPTEKKGTLELNPLADQGVCRTAPDRQRHGDLLTSKYRFDSLSAAPNERRHHRLNCNKLQIGSRLLTPLKSIILPIGISIIQLLH
ncbi:hypothetical protein CDAR_300411 [Caerostris darwini]|uniref:Uncharacterized protein n=1 Tax=Caerostris darwini TaxID=1538125 RepID=A0AAV4W5V5_9ARAC|nr:hypothetical protein CDAR_300411 [Caerostris darwini]